MGTNTACIFNIQKFSLHDGPGIRTTVFFKGCPLRCLWCANPESQRGAVEMAWDEEKCIRCMACVSDCPAQAIINRGNQIVFKRDNCIGCQNCMEICPQRALTAEGELMTLEKVMHEVMQDRSFYEESGGGVTLSGGEVLGQAEFAIALLEALQRENIHTACETTGYAEADVFRRFIEPVDLLLFDLKHYDREKHFAATGVYPEKILGNLKFAIAKGKEVILRIPVIPGINDSLSDAAGFAKLIETIGGNRLDLLPFHQFGQKKYALLNRAYAMAEAKHLREEDLLAYRDVFLEHGMDCRF